MYVIGGFLIYFISHKLFFFVDVVIVLECMLSLLIVVTHGIYIYIYVVVIYVKEYHVV